MQVCHLAWCGHEKIESYVHSIRMINVMIRRLILEFILIAVIDQAIWSMLLASTRDAYALRERWLSFIMVTSSISTLGTWNESRLILVCNGVHIFLNGPTRGSTMFHPPSRHLEIKKTNYEPLRPNWVENHDWAMHWLIEKLC